MGSEGHWLRPCLLRSPRSARTAGPGSPCYTLGHGRPSARPTMLTELGLVLLLALCNAFFALSEIALIASRKSRLKHMARSSAQAKVALRLAEHPERFLSTVQVGITLITLITGAATGTAVSDDIRRWLLQA